MTVTNVQKDAEKLTLTLTAEFEATPERVWQLWADPRQLERWWGPPMYPATFEAHDLRPGGRVTYYMTGPAGDQPHGWWEILEVEQPQRLVLRNGLFDDQGRPNPEFPEVIMRVAIEAASATQTRMTIHSAFPSVAAMEQMVGMGMVEGLTEAVGQIDAILAEKVLA
jgi:uncharacterized protein YndB with AHSA1/START domain